MWETNLIQFCHFLTNTRNDSYFSTRYAITKGGPEECYLHDGNYIINVRAPLSIGNCKETWCYYSMIFSFNIVLNPINPRSSLTSALASLAGRGHEVFLYERVLATPALSSVEFQGKESCTIHSSWGEVIKVI